MPGNRRAIIDEPEKARSAVFEPIIRTLLYFDIFNYPLKEEEILRFLGRRCEDTDMRDAVSNLVERGYIFRFGDFLTVQDKIENVSRRLRGNQMADQMLPLAMQKAGLIGKFPFVRSVMASGSLSKGYMDEDSDLDFFIVTQPGRLWIARMLLVLYKRIFLGNSHKYFCVNYFVSSENLEIEEKNLFTATELATVIPLYNQKMYSELLRNNGWLTRFYPNFIARPVEQKPAPKLRFKGLLETSINLLGGSMIDEWCMKLTYRRWKKVYSQSYDPADFKIAFKTKRSASKNHPKHYQRKVTELLDQKWRAYSEHYNLDLV